MDKLKKYAIIILIAIEVGVIALTTRFPTYRAVIVAILAGIAIFAIIYFNKLVEKNLLRLFGLFNNRFGTAMGLLQLVFLLIHIGLLTDALHDWYRFALHPISGSSVCVPTVQSIIYLSFLCGLLLLPVSIKTETSKASDRTLLVIPISKVSVPEPTENPIPFSLLGIKSIHEFYKSEGANLQHVWLISNDDANESLTIFLNHFYKGQPYTIANFFQEYIFEGTPLNIKIKNIEADANHFQDYYQETTDWIEKEIAKLKSNPEKPFTDNNATFSVLGGNKIISIAMAFLAMPKARGAVYIPQNNDSTLPHEFDLSVLTFEKLANELLNKLGDDS